MGIVESPVVFGCGQNRYIISRSIRHRRRLSPWALPSCHGPASISRDVRQYWLNYAALDPGPVIRWGACSSTGSTPRGSARSVSRAADLVLRV